ncbi:helix-turn-helix domain-containing protein [Bradyrhizobium sp.]|uniref:helix-turn-helix domain-containing protein n=1 Tax=Bradyrhizobium sp. TaxID=376 RepID=UPI0007C8B027|nr:helix-turn-helix domain-containing protein [Bradyrhizobium sp.]
MSEILTISDVAKLLKMAEETVHSMVLAGELPAFEIRGQWRMRRLDFEAWLERLANGAQGALGAEMDRSSSVPTIRPKPEQESSMPAVSEPAVSHLTARISQAEMHDRLIALLGKRILRHGPKSAKPLEVDLGGQLPVRVRIYMFNATRPPGGRPLGEHKVQLIVPGQRRGQRGSFDHGDDRVVLLVGYAAEEDVYILWDAGLYADFAWSRNVQVKAETIIEATAGKLATQIRQLRPAEGPAIVETLIAAPADRLAEAIDTRIQLSRQRLIEG